MGFTRAEFMQILPSALRNHTYHIDDQLITIPLASGLITIQLGAEQVRKIARLALPYLPVSIDFTNIPAEDFQKFLQHFDLYYRKGGG
jgi:hypothetical protein